MPENGIQARFSLSFAVALGMLGVHATPEEFCGDHLQREDIRALLKKVEILDDPAMERWSSRIELVLLSGECLSAEVLVPRGMGQRQLGWADLEKKFGSAARRHLGGRAQELCAAIRSFGEAGNAESIRALLADPTGEH